MILQQGQTQANGNIFTYVKQVFSIFVIVIYHPG